MSNTSAKIMEEIHDAGRVEDVALEVAGKTKNVVHKVGEKREDEGR